MRDGLRLADSDTGCRFNSVTGTARSTAVLHPFTPLMFYKCHRFFTEDINLIRPHLEDFGLADFRALAATIALVRVDDDIPVARPILKTVIGYHVFSFSPLTLSLSRQSLRLETEGRGNKRITLFSHSSLCPFSAEHFQRGLPRSPLRAVCQRDNRDRYTLSCSKPVLPF
jgi:hypothetical protein